MQIRADLVIAAVEVIAAVVGRVERIVRNGVQHARHSRVLIVLELDRVLLSQTVGVVEGIVDLREQLVGDRKHCIEQEGQADDDDDALEQARQNAAHRLTHLVAGVHRLLRHRDDGEHEAQQNADQRHSPVHVLHDGVAKENVHQRLGRSLVAHLGHAAHHGEELIQNADDPAKRRSDPVKNSVQETAQNAADAADDPIPGCTNTAAKRFNDFFAHDSFSSAEGFRTLSQRTSNRFLEMTIYTPTAARTAATRPKKIRLFRSK